MSKTSIERLKDTELKLYRVSGETMGTRYTATFYASPHIDDREVTARLGAAVGAVDDQMSNWKDNSDLSRLNRASQDCWVPVSGNLAALLMRAQQIGHDTHNAFNIGVGDLVNQWGFGPSSGVSSHLSTGNCPGAAPRRPVDDLIEVDEHRCRVRKRGPTVLDLCGIAKGFGVDELGRVLSDYGISAWLVGIDGEMCAHGGKPDGSPWSIALEAPDYDQRATMGVIELTDAAIATSGDYRRWTEIDDARISHTIDPRTGTPLANGVASVTVVARTCVDADAYATALMVLGEHAGRDYAQQRGLDALLVVRDGEALRTVGVGCFADGQPARVSLVS